MLSHNMDLTRRQLLSATSLGAAALAGCTGGQTGGESQMTTTDGGGDGTTVTMQDSAYQPLKAEISPGTSLTWTNEDSVGHTVTSTQFTDGAASWDLDEQVADGGSVSFTFEEAGVYEYYCTIHGESTMCGAVLVGDASMSGSLPCGDGGGSGGDGGGGGVY